MKRETIKNILNFLKEKENKEFPENFNLIHELETHPDGAQYRYEGDLYLNDFNITKLPNDLHVTGALNLYRCQQLTELPDNLYVGENFILYRCKKITGLPNDLYIGGSLNLSDNNDLTELPDNLHVGRWLDLRRCRQITEIPNNLFVARDFFIANTPLADKYTNVKLRKMIKSKGGTIIGKIIRE